jgi:hypothetical protein
MRNYLYLGIPVADWSSSITLSARRLGINRDGERRSKEEIILTREPSPSMDNLLYDNE